MKRLDCDSCGIRQEAESYENIFKLYGIGEFCRFLAELKGVIPTTPRKEKALQALLVCRTRAEAAKAAGIGESTLREYMKDPEFSAAYKHAAACIMDGATRQLQQNLTAAIDRLAQIVADDEENSMAQISAAKTLLDYGLRFTEFNDILKMLEENNAL